MKPTNLRERFLKLKEFDQSFEEELELVCGMDEAGRGALAGRIYAACVILPEDCIITEIYDSKQISENSRFLVEEKIKNICTAYGIGFADVYEINKIKIQKANFLAFRRAYEDMISNFSVLPNIILVDGNYKGIGLPNYRSIIKSDSSSLSIAAASILAKTARDRHMIDTCQQSFPDYNFKKNKGYGTKEHIDAVKKLGLSEIHRKIFAGILLLMELIRII